MYLQYTALACTAAASSDLPYNWLTPLEMRKHKYIHQKIMHRYSIAFHLCSELCHQHLDSQAQIYIIHAHMYTACITLYVYTDVYAHLSLTRRPILSFSEKLGISRHEATCMYKINVVVKSKLSLVLTNH